MSANKYALDPEYAAWLAQRRRFLGLSQNALALAIGVSESTIGKYERLAAPVAPEVRQALEKALDTTERRYGKALIREER